jgi:hypothetical protein
MGDEIKKLEATKFPISKAVKVFNLAPNVTFACVKMFPESLLLTEPEWRAKLIQKKVIEK